MDKRPSAATFAALMLWGILLWVAFNLQDAAASPTRSCEQPTNSTTVPAAKPPADMTSLMDSWLAEKIEILKIEIWWRERIDSRKAAADATASSTMSELLAQMDAWWRERSERPNTAASTSGAAAAAEVISHKCRRGGNNEPRCKAQP